MRRPTLVALCALFLLPVGRAAASGSVRVEIKDPKGAPVADAIASLMPLGAPPPLAPPADPVVITQVKEEFQPYVTAVVVGTRVAFPNRDKVQHHVFSLSKPKPFDLGLYHGDPKELVTFDQPGVVTLGCNIHDWMAAYVVVLGTPHFSKSADDGLAPIASLPPGKYRLEVWHPRLKAVVTREVTVDTSPVSQVIAVTLGIDRRIRRAPESGAGSYK
jgi:plastocyanin